MTQTAPEEALSHLTRLLSDVFFSLTEEQLTRVYLAEMKRRGVVAVVSVRTGRGRRSRLLSTSTLSVKEGAGR